MPSKKSVAEIKTNLLRPALTSHFEVQIVPPPDLQSYINPKQEKLNLACCEVDLPGSSLATSEINNDFTGVTERHAYRRIFEETTNFAFYVDAGDYTPIRFFEQWIEYATNGPLSKNARKDLLNPNYFYRMRYPDGDGLSGKGGYIGKTMRVVKFERDYRPDRTLEYEFVKCFPLAITSMPLSYESSSLLKCNVSMTYIRYVVNPATGLEFPSNLLSRGFDPRSIVDQSLANAKSFAAGKVGAAVDNAVDRLTGNDRLGDIAGGFARGAIGNLF